MQGDNSTSSPYNYRLTSSALHALRTRLIHELICMGRCWTHSGGKWAQESGSCTARVGGNLRTGSAILADANELSR